MSNQYVSKPNGIQEKYYSHVSSQTVNYVKNVKPLHMHIGKIVLIITER